MNKYRVTIKGALDYGKGIGTAGVDVEKYYQAETHSEAKELFKGWVSEQMKRRRALGFTGTISAWLVEETQLLDEQPFEAQMSFTEEVVVDI